jgi:long-chain acyl-CoA synthetase
LPSAIAVIGEAFTEQNGLVNSTMKIIRGKVTEHYANRIAKLYESGGKEIINQDNINALN